MTVAAGGTCGRDDHSGTINLTVADVDSPAAELTLSVLSSNPALVPTGNIGFAGNGAARTMTVSAVDGRSGTATLTVTVSDGQNSGSVQVTVMVGGGGKDTLTGGSGADLLLAQSNNDTLTGGDGNDLLCGDSGGDTLSGGAGDDSLGGGSGTDRLTGGSGADRFSGGSGTDTATDFTATEGDTNDGVWAVGTGPDNGPPDLCDHMRAIQITRFGPPEVLTLATVPEPDARARRGPRPHPRHRRELLRHRAPPGRVRPARSPWIPGREAAGVIDIVGEGVDPPSSAPASPTTRAVLAARTPSSRRWRPTSSCTSRLACRSRPWPLSPSRALPLGGWFTS